MNNQSNNAENACGGFGKPSQGVLTMAFVNPQPFEQVYSLSDSFSRGTLFPDLDKPFLRGGARI